MAKPEWGVKRTCQSCGARFYDMQRSPIHCPKCRALVEPEVTFKARRSSAPAAEPKVVVPVVDDEVALEVEADDQEVVEEEAADAVETPEDDESGLIEDASDLGEDDDDMAEVMEHLDEDLEDEV